ncbi:MAG: hypothetical protein ACJZ3J_00310 [Candidatus Poseidoniales archaeon]|jgi:hypothetical protein|uniref:Uncharacterized protein n=1 Tax=Marine Group III euryarchaeote CG-Epi1 TaxID=1888995 RepID=A0A1J5TAL0_9ARCH|nr:MAG: hypothetical protein BD935_02075 [Marine Group III euryarchaeote CG-Epi1]|tara:strand:- start:109 stop:729 length:621 start_codon:yes stop_codon:yes gene_type:complete
MKASKIVISIAVAILVSFQVYSPTVSAHTGENFMIIIKENGSVPGNPTMMVNDSALWVNVDNRDNVTHQIFVDANSDGIYNGSDDWKSLNLTHEGNCRNDNGTRIENCEASYTVTFNETVMNMSYYDIVGTYAYVDIDSNGTKFYGNITVIPELHVTAGFQDTNANNIDEAKDEEEDSSLLLIIAAASALGAMILGGMILFGNEEE